MGAAIPLRASQPTHPSVRVDSSKMCCHWYPQKRGPPSSERSWEPLVVLGRQGAGAASASAGALAGTPGGGAGRGSRSPRTALRPSILVALALTCWVATPTDWPATNFKETVSYIPGSIVMRSGHQPISCLLSHWTFLSFYHLYLGML